MSSKLHTSINIFGLAIGISSCLVLFLIVNYEISFNKKIDGYERIYRVYSTFSGTFTGQSAGVPTAVVPTIRDQFTHVDAVTLLNEFNARVQIPSGNELKDYGKQPTLVFTDTSFFSVFSSYEWIAGSPKSLLKPFNVVITESRAQFYFNSDDPQKVIGREIIYQDSISAYVSGVVKDFPFTTDIDFTDFISQQTLKSMLVKRSFRLDDWISTNSANFAFIKLAKNSKIEQVHRNLGILDDLYKKHRISEGTINNFQIEPLNDLHFSNKLGIFNHSRPAAERRSLSIMILISLSLLIAAGLNFINLETAKAITRSKEVGIRKVLGSQRRQLILQFLAESFVVASISGLLALPLTKLIVTFFSEFIPTGITILSIDTLVFLLLIIISVATLAGLYPAIVLSSFEPVNALKSSPNVYVNKSGSISVRQILILIQCAVAQVFICCTLIFFSQLDYLLNKDLGFTTDSIIYFSAPWKESQLKTKILKEELLKIPIVEDVTLSDEPPSADGFSSLEVLYKNKDDILRLNVFRKFGDPHFLDFYEIKVLAGKPLQKSDTVKELIINRAMMEQLGFSTPNDVINELIEFNGKSYPIIGVVENFHIRSLHNKIEPVMISNEESNFYNFNVKLSTKGNFNNEILAVHEAWKKVYGDNPFTVRIINDTIGDFYASEQRTSKLVSAASALAIIISCLGLFGLVSYATVQRIKEISIRKILGATGEDVALLLSREFVKLILISFLTSLPFTYITANYWLENYPYHVPVNLVYFIYTFILMLGISLLTISFFVVKAAKTNPAESLRVS